MKFRLLVLVGLVLSMVIGCVPPAKSPEKDIECSSREDCYFKALVVRCKNDVFAEYREKKDYCIRRAHREIRDECKEHRTGMGNLCGELPPPPPPPPPPPAAPLTPEERYRQALVSKCTGNDMNKKSQCIIEAQRQISKECAENPKGMSGLCK